MAVGTVKFFNDPKGWGIISPEDEGLADVFVHFSQIIGQEGRKTLLANQVVSYHPIKTPKGWQAECVEVVGMSEPEDVEKRKRRREMEAGDANTRK